MIPLASTPCRLATFFVIAAISAKGMAAEPDATPGPNLVPNPGMELGNAVPEGWSVTSGGGTLGRETTSPAKGAASLRVTSNGNTMTGIRIPGEFSTKTMTLSGRVRGEGANAMLGKAANAWSPAPGFYPEFPEAWMTIHRSLKEKAAQGGVDLLFIGDSLTLGWDKELWEKNQAPRKAANYGVGGDGTPQLLWRLENGGFDGLQPKVAVVMIGINNVWPGFSAEDTAKGIRTFVGRLREKMPSTRILLLGMLPAFDENDSIRNYSKIVNADISKLDDGNSVRFLDFGKDLLEADGKRRQGFYEDDRLHLRKPAYEAWNAAMEPFLKTVF